MSKYEIHAWKNPRLPFHFKKMVLDENKKNSGANWHENLELMYFEEGEGAVLNEGTKIRVVPGDVVIINSNNLHDIFTEKYLSYHYLIIDRSFCMTKKVDTNKIMYKIGSLREEELNYYFKQLVKEYSSNETSDYKTETIRDYVSLILMYICRNCANTLQEEEDTTASSYVERAIGYIHSNSHSPDLSLDEIAEFVGLSKFYFAHQFRKHTGMTCVQFINKTRCEKAKILLEEKRLGISEISACCGFNSQSYFTRTFHAYTGIAPGSYQQSIQKIPKKPNTSSAKAEQESEFIDIICY